MQWNHREWMLIGMVVVEWKDILNVMKISQAKVGKAERVASAKLGK